MALLAVAVLVTACATASSAAPDPGAGCEPAPPGFAHGVTQLSGTRLHWVRGGRGDPVVLVPGFPETWATWRGVMSRLARERTVLAVDPRGVGCSALTPDGYDKQTLAADLHELAARLGLGRVAVVGHDLGGMTAFAWARAHPDQVDRLVVAGAGIPGLGLEEAAPPHVAAFAADPGAVERRAAGDLRGFLRAFVADPAVETSGVLDAAARAYAPPGRLAAALRQYAALPRDAAANRAAGPLPPATRVLALDGGAPGITAASLRRAATTVQTAVVPGGHYAQVDRPEAFADTVAAFLR